MKEQIITKIFKNKFGNISKDLLKLVSTSKEFKSIGLPKKEAIEYTKDFLEISNIYINTGDISIIKKKVAEMTSSGFKKGIELHKVLSFILLIESEFKKVLRKYFPSQFLFKNIYSETEKFFHNLEIMISQYFAQEYYSLYKSFQKAINKNKRQYDQLSSQTNKLNQSRLALLNILEDLEKSYSKLKKINEIKSEFIRVVSHQLRTPLSSIKWINELLINEDVGKLTTKEQKDVLNLALQEVHNLIEVLNDLLDVQNIDTVENIISKKDTVSLPKFIKSILEEVEKQTKENNCKIIFETEKNKLPRVLIDSNKIKRVIKILINNAIQYSANNCIINISLKEEKIGNKKFLQFSISDQGIGIPIDQQKRVFKKFFRARNAPIHSPNGLGLELYIVKNYIETHGGNVWFESSEGKGTTFYFQIPIK